MLLAGDIGGTKTVLAVFAIESGIHAPLAQSTFLSTQYASLEDIISEFLQQTHLTVAEACFGVAGPVVAGQARITNLPWVISETIIEQTFGLKAVRLLNDLEAIANAIPVLQLSDRHTLNIGQALDDGAIGIIAPGTGLGEAFLTWEGNYYHTQPSEGGHASFAPTNDLEMGLLRYMLNDRGFTHISFERVCSGMGLPNIYAYLRDSGYAEEPDWLAAQLATASDPTPVIVNAALDQTKPCQLCATTLDMFMNILGAEAGNLALKTLATGGIYVGGGIPPRILPALERSTFMPAFRNKGRMSDLLARIPVHVITHPQTALLGAANYGMET
jgi:glucokinase